MKERQTQTTEVVEAMRTMRRLGLNRGTAGNASVRCAEGFLISPSGVRIGDLDHHTIVLIDRDGAAHGANQGARPSSEWLLHQAVFEERSDVHAIVHCHSRFASVMACARRPIPAIHYLVALCGASEVPVTPYARFGTEDLARHTADALSHCDACLLANHGLVACGDSMSQALELAEEIEEQAALYWHTLAIGGGFVLGEAEMREVHGALDVYRDRR